MTLLYRHPLFQEHRTGDHPECPERLVAIEARLTESGRLGACTEPAWQPLTPEQVARVHEPEYTGALAEFAASGGGRVEADTVVSARSFDAALLAAGATCDAVRRVVAGEDRSALCLVRPPGHHARPVGAMGFCLLGNVALAARTATEELGLNRVLIVDWDVHHGNGTQEVFWNDPKIGFLSIHRWPFYPGSGAADEAGGPAACGLVNLPVAFGTSRRDYLDLFTTRLESLADRLRPELVLVSAGFDSHRADPVGSLGLESEDFQPLTRSVLEIAAAHAGGRVVSVLEGGYHTGYLAECVELHLGELLAPG